MKSSLPPDPELAALVERGLKQLPWLSAPRTLVPNVLAALETRLARRWWRRAWWDWPLAPRVAFLFLSFALIAFVSTGGWFISDGWAAGRQVLGERFSTLADLGQRFAPVTDTGTALMERFGTSFLHYGGIAALLAYVACLGAGTALIRVVGKRS